MSALHIADTGFFVALGKPSRDSKHECVEVLDEEGIPASAAESAADAVRDADVVVTATSSTEPVFPADALAPGTLVVAIGAYESGMQELEPVVFDRAARVFAENTARNHLERLVEMHVLLKTDREGTALYTPDPLYHGYRRSVNSSRSTITRASSN